jgi:hypothetical protein
MVLFYDADVGEVEVHQLAGKNLEKAKTFKGWRKTWSKIVPMFMDGKNYVLLYDRGVITIFQVLVIA